MILLVSSMVSYVIARQKWGKYLYVYFSFGIMIPLLSVIIQLNVIFKQIGILNTRIGIITAFVVANVPLAIFIITAFMKGLPMEIEEAARMDGCSRSQTFAVIILPMSKAALATAGTLAFINCWNDLLLSMTVVSRTGLTTLNYAVYSLKGQYVTDYGIITAGMMTIIVPAMIIYSLFQEQIIRGTISGAIKG